MTFHNVEEALHALEDPELDSKEHQNACHYLAGLNEKEEAKGLVQSLESDDLGVRWEAANILAEMGSKSISAVLKALMDPNRVGDQRLKDGVIHMIHEIEDPELKRKLEPLITTLQGPAADISTMWEAYHLLNEIRPDTFDQEH